MHKLDRSSVPVPDCLQSPPDGRRYEHLTMTERAEIRSALLDMQDHRCAYCERRTGHDRNDGHVEHFRGQASHADLDLAWDNMFWSCNDEATCGKHKDKCSKQSGRLARCDPKVLIDPSLIDPEGYLVFVSDGTVRPREGLEPDSRHRAEETIRVFQIAESAYLRRSREDAVRPYRGMVETLMRFGYEHAADFIRTELDNTARSPFRTAIKHFLASLI